MRLEAGLCLYGHELDIKTTPIEANLKWAISKDRINNGGFIGSENIISKLKMELKKLELALSQREDYC